MKHLRTFQEISEGLISSYPRTKVAEIALRWILNKYGDKKSVNAGLENSSEDGVLIACKRTEFDNIQELIGMMYTSGYYCYLVQATAKNFGRGTLSETVSFIPPSIDDLAAFVKSNKMSHSKKATIMMAFEPKFGQKHKLPDDTDLYHITEKKYLEKIMKKGLIPRGKMKTAYYPDRVYLATIEGIRAIFDRYSEFVSEPVLLKIKNAGEFDLYIDSHAADYDEPYAFYTMDNIGPDRISVAEQSMMTPKMTEFERALKQALEEVGELEFNAA